MKRQYQFFGGLLNAQEKWLNKMAGKGYRLVRAGKSLYDRQNYYKTIRKPYLFMFIISTVPGIAMQTWVWGAFAASFLVPLAFYQIEIMEQRKQSKSKEW